MKKRMLSILLAVCLFCGLLTVESDFSIEAEAKETIQYGLTVDADGNYMLNGKPFHGYGINGTPGNIWHDPNDQTFATCIEVCKKYEIPFIRIPLTYGTIEEYQRYDQGSTQMFDAGKRMLDMAGEAGIGVIVWICNSQRYVSMLGEKASAQGNMDSQSMAFMKKWVTSFVETYKDHPALWGWEIRNEGNLEADLIVTSDSYGGVHQAVYDGPIGEVNGFDSKPSESFMVLYREVANTIREQDSYRMISNGNAIMRESAYHLHQAAQKRNDQNVWTVDWTKDTLAQFQYMNEYLTPDPVDTISCHVGMPPLNFDDYRYVLSDKSLSYAELLTAYVELAQKNKKGFYFGEFGDMGVLTDLNADEVTARTIENLETMVACGVQLGTLWQRNGNNAYVTDEGNLSLILAEIQKVNREFKAQGLQNTEEYWAAVDPYAPTTAVGIVQPNEGKTDMTAADITGGLRITATNSDHEDQIALDQAYQFDGLHFKLSNFSFEAGAPKKVIFYLSPNKHMRYFTDWTTANTGYIFTLNLDAGIISMSSKFASHLDGKEIASLQNATGVDIKGVVKSDGYYLQVNGEDYLLISSTDYAAWSATYGLDLTEVYLGFDGGYPGMTGYIGGTGRSFSLDLNSIHDSTQVCSHIDYEGKNDVVIPKFQSTVSAYGQYVSMIDLADGWTDMIIKADAYVSVTSLEQYHTDGLAVSFKGLSNLESNGTAYEKLMLGLTTNPTDWCNGNQMTKGISAYFNFYTMMPDQKVKLYLTDASGNIKLVQSDIGKGTIGDTMDVSLFKNSAGKWVVDINGVQTVLVDAFADTMSEKMYVAIGSECFNADQSLGDGKMSFFAKVSDPYAAKFEVASLTLGGEIGVNFKLSLGSGLLKDMANTEMRFTLENGDEQILPLSEAFADGGYYVFSCPVAAKEMNDNIHASLRYQDTEVVSYDYAVRKYAGYLIENSSNAKSVAMAKALLSYGAAAQKRFNYKTDALADAGYNLTVAAIPANALDSYTVVKSGEVSGISYQSTTAVLESNTALRHYFKLTDGAITDYTFKLGQTVLTPQQRESDGAYFIELADIPAKELGTSYTVTVTKGNEVFSISCSVYCYIKAVVAGNFTSAEVMTAAYQYCEAAKSYFAK